MTATATWALRLRHWLPAGAGLNPEQWQRRHAVMLWVLWIHVPLLAVVGLVNGVHAGRLALEIGLLAGGTVLAGLRPLSRRNRMLAAVVTLLSCSAVLVHFTGGLTESHFHFFAVVAFITFYQEWLPFVVALVYVFLHHGIIGVLFPESVFEHGTEDTLAWALIHAGFIGLTGFAGILSWRLAELERENVQRILDAAGDGIYGVDPAGRVTFVNPAMYELLGASRDSLVGRSHHLALGHSGEDGPLAMAECPLCRAVESTDTLTGELYLQDTGDAAVPVEYVARRPLHSSIGGAAFRGAVVTVRDLRERKELELQQRDALAERDRLASIVELSRELAVVGAADGQMIWMNPGGRKLLGLDKEDDIRSYRVEDMFSPEEMARVYAEDMPALSRDGYWHGIWRMLGSTGEIIPAATSCYIHPDENAKGGYYVTGFMRDLRPQMEQERRLRESEQRLSAAEEVAGIGSFEWDVDTNNVLWSRGNYLVLGLEPGDGRENFESWSSLIHPEDREQAVATAYAILNGEPRLDFTHRIVRPDNRQERVLHARAELITDDNGQRRVLGTLSDVTEEQAMLNALRRNEELFDRIIESAGDSYVRCGSDGGITGWNAQAQELFDRERADVLGRDIAEVLAPEAEQDAFRQRLGLQRVTDDGYRQARFFKQALRRKSGREFPGELTTWSVESDGGLVYNLIIRDLSERLAAERAKDEFISVVGHELRTPLTSIHGALGLLRAGLLGELNAQGVRMVEIAAHNTDRLVRLINDILDIERLNSGRITLNLSRCDLAELIQRSVEVMTPLANNGGVRLRVDAPRLVLRADADRIEQALTNLISNAIKFSPTGGEVMVTARVDNSEAVITVTDQGRGIPEEHLERIFDRFHQVDSSDAREKGGTGLGLAICRTIAEQHGGRIQARNNDGDGAAFDLLLPLNSPTAELFGMSAGDPAGSATADPDGDPGGDPVVLICGNDPESRASIARLLQSNKYRPVEVGESQDLLDAALEHRPVAILVEQREFSVQGWAPVNELRAHEDTRDIPVVMFSFQGAATDEPDDGGHDDDEPAAGDSARAAVASATLRSQVQGALGERPAPRILLVEDDEDLAAVLSERFRLLGLEVCHAATAREALTSCGETVPELLVLDLQLPDQDGFAVVAQLRRNPKLRSVPLAVYSARELTAADRRRLRLGATRFFTKARVTPDEFERSVVELLDQLSKTVEVETNA